MAFTYTDAMSEIKTLILSNWTKGNTNNITPEFEYIYDKKRIDSFWNGDWILFQDLGETEKPSALGNVGRNRVYRFVIDLRTDYDEDDGSTTGREHLFNMRKELIRIINPNVNYSFTTGIGLIEIDEGTDLSNGKKRLFRRKYTITVTMYNEAVS